MIIPKTCLNLGKQKPPPKSKEMNQRPLFRQVENLHISETNLVTIHANSLSLSDFLENHFNYYFIFKDLSVKIDTGGAPTYPLYFQFKDREFAISFLNLIDATFLKDALSFSIEVREFLFYHL
jgi:hypothetical protein